MPLLEVEYATAYTPFFIIAPVLLSTEIVQVLLSVSCSLTVSVSLPVSVSVSVSGSGSIYSISLPSLSKSFISFSSA